MQKEKSELFIWLGPPLVHRSEITRTILPSSPQKQVIEVTSSTCTNLSGTFSKKKNQQDELPDFKHLAIGIRKTSLPCQSNSNFSSAPGERNHISRCNSIELASDPGFKPKLTSLFCNPSIFRCSEDFVFLPISTKVKMARRATFSSALWQKLINNRSVWSPDTLQQIISLPDIVQPDHVGWLTDLLDNEKCWCVVADIFLCVFENFQSQKARKVIMLPNSTVKAIVFRSSSLNSISHNSTLDNVSSRSPIFILGEMNLDMYQFFIDSEETGKKYKFSALSQDSLDKWVSVLKAASFLTTDIYVTNLTLEIFPHTIISKKASWSPASSESRSTEYSNETGYKSRSDSSISDHQDLDDCRMSIDSRSDDLEQSCDDNCNTNIPKPKPELSNNEPLRKSFGAKIVRTASSIKLKLRQKTKSFSNSKKISGNLSQNDISGYLQYHGLIKWSKLWCLVKENIFYAFKSKTNTETPEINFLLEDYKVFIVEDNKNHYTFKLSRPKTKSVALKARDGWDFERWLDFFRLRGVEVIDNYIQTPDNTYEWLSRISHSNEVSYATDGNDDDEMRSVSDCATSVNLLHLDPSDSSCSNADNSSMEGSIDFCEIGSIDNGLTSIQSEDKFNNNHHRQIHKIPISNAKYQWKSEKDISRSYTTHLQLKHFPALLKNDEDQYSEMGPIEHSGWLYIYGQRKIWQRYFVTLQKRILRWYDSPEDCQPQGVINMAECDCEMSSFEEVKQAVKVTPKTSGTPMYLYASMETESQEWLEKMKVYSPSYNKRQLESLNLECSNLDHYKNNDEMCQHWKEKFLKMQRVQLLEEVLRVKSEIEMKKRKTMPHRMNEADIAIKYQRALTEEEQKALRLDTYLRLRRISTQIKFENLQKQLLNKQKNKLWKNKSPQDMEILVSENHLLELTERLSEIDQKLQKNEKQKVELRKALETKREREIQMLKDQGYLQNNFKAIHRTPSLKVSGEMQKSEMDTSGYSFQSADTVTNDPPKNGKKTFEDWKKKGALKLFSDFKFKTGLQKKIKPSTSLSDLQLVNNLNHQTHSNLDLPALVENEVYRTCSVNVLNDPENVNSLQSIVIKDKCSNIKENSQIVLSENEESLEAKKNNEEISPRLIAQIEEFEQMVQNYLSLSENN